MDVLNPRRAPRLLVRCTARVALQLRTYFATCTRDVGPGGCQLDAPGPVEVGSRVFLEIADGEVPDRAALTGRIAWCSPEPPWRIGIAFDDDDVLNTREARGLLARLEIAHPDLCGRAEILDRIPEDAPLAPTPPPGSLPALTPDEIHVLRTVGPGMQASDLRSALGARWEGCSNSLFALLRGRCLVIGAPDPRAAGAWAERLAAAGAEAGGAEAPPRERRSGRD